VKPRGRFALKVAAAGLAAALLAGAAAYVAATGHGPGEGPGPAPTGPTPSRSATPGPAAPAGYRWADDPGGFRFLLPVAGGVWLRTTDSGNQIFYSPDNKVHYLQFAVTVGQSTRPLDHFEQMEATVSKLKDYRKAKMADARVNGHDAAVWEFTYAAKDGGRRHAIEAEFIDDQGTAYAVYLSCPDKDWTEGEQRFTTVLNSFEPTR
jgi:hypothetical protein